MLLSYGGLGQGLPLVNRERPQAQDEQREYQYDDEEYGDQSAQVHIITPFQG
ncbi:hypothetical protein SDC9_115600 [bioreactor metagenome]|uniref:Uncharacterized protein n=1 Tax=bioreactor metagenome TaxID=1076179 RepID=A0A645BTG6_9ZZZZ